MSAPCWPSMPRMCGTRPSPSSTRCPRPRNSAHACIRCCRHIPGWSVGRRDRCWAMPMPTGTWSGRPTAGTWSVPSMCWAPPGGMAWGAPCTGPAGTAAPAGRGQRLWLHRRAQRGQRGPAQGGGVFPAGAFPGLGLEAGPLARHRLVWPLPAGGGCGGTRAAVSFRQPRAGSGGRRAATSRPRGVIGWNDRPERWGAVTPARRQGRGGSPASAGPRGRRMPGGKGWTEGRLCPARSPTVPAGASRPRRMRRCHAGGRMCSRIRPPA